MTLRTLMFSAIVLASPVRRSPAPSGPTRCRRPCGTQRRDRMGRHRPAGDPRSGGAAIGRHLRDPPHDGAPRRLRRGRGHRRRLAAVRREDRRPARRRRPRRGGDRGLPHGAAPHRRGATWSAFDQAYTTYLAALPGGDSSRRRRPRRPAGRGRDAGAARQRRLRQRRALRVQHGAAADRRVHAGHRAARPGPTSAQPVDAKVGGITPFTLKRADVFRPDGPDPLESKALRPRLRRDARLRTRRQHRAVGRTDRRRLVLGREPLPALEPQPDGAGAGPRPEHAEARPGSSRW